MRCIVKGSRPCRFEVNVGEVFTANKKRGELGNGFKVVNHRGQLHSELVDPLWSLHADISVLVNYYFYIIVNINEMCLQLLPATKLCFLCVDSGSANLQPIDTN